MTGVQTCALPILTIIVFALSNVLPGDVGRQILGPFAPQESVDELNHRLGTDQPLVTQYLNRMEAYARFDLGDSYKTREPVSHVIGSTFLNSAKLALLALLVTVPLGILGGIIAALRRSLAPEPDWSALEEALILSDAGTATARVVIDEAKGLRDGDGTTRLRSVLLKALDDGANASPADVRDPSVILLVGVNGAGKTTTAAKLAARAQSAGGTPLLVAADTFRAAAIDQLRLLAEREQVPVIEGRPGGDPAAAIHDALTAARVRGLSPVIIDTAGRLQTKHGLMDELAKMRRVIEKLAPDARVEVLLVLDATAGQNGLAQARGFDRAAGVDGVVLTKLDAGARGGVALSVRRELSLPVRWVCVGEGSRDLLPFDAGAFVDGLLGLAR